MAASPGGRLTFHLLDSCGSRCGDSALLFRGRRRLPRWSHFAGLGASSWDALWVRAPGLAQRSSYTGAVTGPGTMGQLHARPSTQPFRDVGDARGPALCRLKVCLPAPLLPQSAVLALAASSAGLRGSWGLHCGHSWHPGRPGLLQCVGGRCSGLGLPGKRAVRALPASRASEAGLPAPARAPGAELWLLTCFPPRLAGRVAGRSWLCSHACFCVPRSHLPCNFRKLREIGNNGLSSFQQPEVRGRICLALTALSHGALR